MRAWRAGNCGKRRRVLVLLAVVLILGMRGAAMGWGQDEGPPAGSAADRDETGAGSSLAGLGGLPVQHIDFEGVSADRVQPLRERLALKVGAPLTEQALARSLRTVFDSGLFETVAVKGSRENGGVALTFAGTARSFIGTVSVYGARGATINAQLERASRLEAGTRFAPGLLEQAVERMRQVLADNGYHEPAIAHTLTPHPVEQLTDIAFQVTSGPQARVGTVAVSGDAGMSAEMFRRYARLRAGNPIDHETVSRALGGVLKHYQRENRLEADVKLEAQTYDPAAKRTDFRFTATRGPVVRLRMEGASLDNERLKRAIPIYEEGTVDEDLLNEGDRRLRDYYQRLGYFDVKVEHQRQTPQADEVTILYHVTLGTRRKVEKVSIDGNHYFDTDTLKDLLSVHTAGTLDRRGSYSQALVAADVSALKAVYQNNGFSAVKVTPETNLSAEVTATGRVGKPAGLAVAYHIDEGAQQRVGKVALEGDAQVKAQELLPLLNTTAGQLASPQYFADDRGVLLTEYLSRGFEQAQVNVEQKPETGNANLLDVTFHIMEGPQIFVRKVLLTGLHYTRPATAERKITLHPGDRLNQQALQQTQQNLYDLALFNEVDTAVENPTGGETHKTVLVQAAEARRWTFTYGGGFETQTGTPQNNCAGLLATGTPCNPNGKTGISPRVLGDLTRNNLFGREQSASIQGTYGLLEQKINLIYQVPHIDGHPNFGLSFTGGYANSQDVTTYVASKLDGGVRVTEHFTDGHALFSRANTFIYEFDFRRVKVAGSSLQVFPTEIAELSAAVRVAGPGLTWIRDTRDSPLDEHRGTYTSLQEFVSGHAFGSQAQFNRLDLSNSSFYGFDKNRFVIARNTRYAQERAFGENSDELIPLPERLYAGGATSLRGFSVNAAGPRDPETGFPIGGAGALINSTELRLPPPTLPWLGDSVSFVLFHDTGNVFANAGDAWKSALRVRQPDRDSCKVLSQGATNDPPTPTTPPTSVGPLGGCSFNYFSHAAGLGLRYHTPVGPIRLDFSYNLNPPIYPVNVNYSHSNPYLDPHVGEAGHFNFFFSLGQTF
ncbi:MAG TPA: POTRA domain-containing protein [Terracidiphilus sp.]|nr:POTRA domain-containing protein [Terracidiphilus sp.]